MAQKKLFRFEAQNCFKLTKEKKSDKLQYMTQMTNLRIIEYLFSC